MPRYLYLKIPPGKGNFYIKKKIFLAVFKQTSPFLLIPLGLGLLSLVFYSFFSYRFLVFRKFRNNILAPISEVAVAETKGIINPLVAGVSTSKDFNLP